MVWCKSAWTTWRNGERSIRSEHGRNPMTGARFIGPPELEALMPMIEKGECILLDIRSPAEFRSGHIGHARLIPAEELERRVEELDKSKTLVIYCRSGKRCLRALPVLTA